MASLEDVAEAKIVSDEPGSEMGVSDAEPKGDRTKVLNLRKCDAVVSEQVVESEVIVESSVNVNGSEGEFGKSCDENDGNVENSLEEMRDCKPTGGEQLDVMDVDGCEGGAGDTMDDKEDGFRVGDFVWGKIKSHPWWPGQVYDPEDASEFAMARKQEGRLLVAFFGDGSCSWCSLSQLVPFVDKFSEMSRDSSSKSFLNAVQTATDEVGRLMELEMTCKCVPEEKRESLVKPEVINAGLRAGVVVPEVDVCRLSLPEYEPADVLDRVAQLAKVVSVGDALDLAVLRSWLSAFCYFTGGRTLTVYHEPFDIEGLEEKNRDVNGTGDGLGVPVEVPVLGPQDDDWLSSPTARSVNSQVPSESKVLHRRKQRSVAELMGENKNVKPDKEGTDVEKSTTTRKRKKDNEQPSSTAKRGKKRKAEVSLFPMITDAKDDGANRGKLSRKPKEIDVSTAEEAYEARDDSDTVSTPRERKRSKYLSPPYTNLAWRLGSSSFKSLSSFKSVAQVENGEATKTGGELTETATSQPISMDNGPTGSVSDTRSQTVKDGKKLSFPVSDVDVPVNELLLEIQRAALDPFYLSKKGSLDTVWAFVSALRSSTYLHGSDYKIYLKRQSALSQLRIVSNGRAEEKTANRSPEENTPIASKTPKKTKKSASVAKSSVESEKGRTLPCLTLSFTPGFPLPSKKLVVGLFGKFGSLSAKKTKVEKDSHSIRVVYTKDSDAEAAFESSSSTCPFGSENVSYSLQRCPAGSKSRPPEAGGLVSDLSTIKQKLEITTAIVENYCSRFSSEEESGLKDEMKLLMEKTETVGEMVRVIAEKSTS
ncbi:PWWP domain-containing protein 6-like [Salvia divinorum]|uniref:PWWP domain-containing protein 6-like n=1 Tax=Salvia divinorum TaxID=28513 RepID=A0ABD1FII1_SALDI